MPSIKTVFLGLISLLFVSVSTLALDKETESEVQRLVEERWQELMASDEFQQKVNQGILNFVEEQNKQQQQAEMDRKSRGTKQLLPVSPERDHIRGNPNAEFTLLEYSDTECPFCKRFHETAIEFTERHDDVNWVYRHFPLNSHNPGAQQQAEASECVASLAGNDAFWVFIDKIYSQTRSGGRGFPANKLAPAAESSGVNRDDFNACLNNGTFREKVLQDLANGQASGVTGTPGNFLIHNPSGTLVVITGAQPLENLERTLEALRTQFGS